MRTNSLRCRLVVGALMTAATVGVENRTFGDDATLNKLRRAVTSYASFDRRRTSSAPQEHLRRFSRRVQAVRDFPPDDRRIVELRGEIHRFLKTPAGKEILEPSLSLVLRLPARGGRPPAAPSFPFSAEKARRYQRAYAEWTGLPREVTNRDGISFVLVPPGSFVMGSPATEAGHRKTPYDETQHPVRLTRPFYLSKHETTVGQFRRFVTQRKFVTDGEKNGGGHAHDAKAVWKHRPGTSWRKPGYAGPFKMRDSHPVVHVSHTDAIAFCIWLARWEDRPARSKLTKPTRNRLELPVYDLPTEAQWEWAARAGSGSRYWWGNDDDTTGKVINAGDRSLKRIHPEWPRKIMPMDDRHAFPAPVGSYRDNAFGLHDMLGNVWEFCSTRYGRFPKTLAIDPGDLDPKRGFAVRGGGWSNTPQDARCATRNADPPHFCHSNLGFRVALQLPPRNLTHAITDDRLPYRVHVVETYETEIEKRWWLRGKPVKENVPPSLSASVPNRQACRAEKTLTFDRKMGDRTQSLKGVIFNPVPGPPMGKNTRLSFRYYLQGTDTITVQIYSLSRNYHRHLVLTKLPQGKWNSATVDMTEARRPDGSGGPLSENERIDDIQFYINPDAQLLIDDIVLYDAARKTETRPFPRRIIFTGWFDTGKQGKEWPGDFKIVLHKKPLTWDAAQSVLNRKTGKPWIRVEMRGQRTLSKKTALRFRYHLNGKADIDVMLVNSKTGRRWTAVLKSTTVGRWSETTVEFAIPRGKNDQAEQADELQFLVRTPGLTLFVDDVLLYEPRK